MAKTKKDLRGELAALGFTADDDATKADLATLLAEVKTAGPWVFTDDKDTTAAVPVTVGPTGLCLQCGLPADHIHRGV